ncbi:spermidine/putrescine ABC transporter substrate-binding protein [Rhodovulum sulfidophilum]|uniref:Extracellular solute-binding protein n=1 Tax=Rhodovulum visakhapatnamense TaxID=364297 RepID=A0ABS1RHI7_9RHOB|nr:extracellular solute-binding protein [Rhodovulum visakhapatnamense]MBL3571250.1 extracellular solute-binding protein [Rhodovulum visakhapatnamense]MBL3579122.1 extracellular solute-binding protein [Rhodovulum visakhapatnamense]OLS46081.1 spermidine/putrescine ABC transporter substrate-binding protein [Rhodovulum sulfidophilum]
MTIRHLLSATALAALPAGFAFAEDLPPCEGCADSLTVVSWGGAYQTSQQKAYSEPYAEMTGTGFTWDESSNEAVAKLRAMNEAGNVTWDLVDVEGPDSQRLCDEGLAMEVDLDEMLAPGADGTPASEDFGDSVINDCFVPQIVFSTTFGYRTDVAAWNGKEPETLCALFDTETFPGKRSLEKRPKKNLEWALLCDGVTKDELYDVLDTPEGVDRALAKLDTIKDDVIWWSAGAETPQRLADGEVVIGSTYNGRLFSLIVEQKQPVKMLWDWQVFDYDGWIIPADLPEDRLNRVMHFLHFATDTQRLADQAKYISYGPSRASSQPLVSTHAELGIEMAPFMPTNPENQKNYLVNNIEWWADNQDDVEAKFQAWLAR